MIFGRFTVKKPYVLFGWARFFRYFILHERHLFPAIHITNCTFFTNFKTLVIYTINLLVVLWYKNWQTDVIIYENHNRNFDSWHVYMKLRIVEFYVTYNNNKCPVTKILVLLFVFFPLMLMVSTLQGMSLKKRLFYSICNYLDNFTITVFLCSNRQFIIFTIRN